MIPYEAPDLLEDLDAIKNRIRKATYTGRDLNKLARVFTVDALTLFVSCTNDETQAMSDRLRAAEILLNRGWGKAPITIESDNSFAAHIAAAAAKLDEKLAQIMADGAIDAQATVVD